MKMKGPQNRDHSNPNSRSSNDEGPLESKTRVAETLRRLTRTDKQILRALIVSRSRISSVDLARKLEMPLTTIQRRRKRLESEFLEPSYSIRLDKLGWRTADLLITTSKGMASSIGKRLLTHNSITDVFRCIGEHKIELHVKAVFKNNNELLNLIEWIKSREGVKDVAWMEAVELLGKNRPIPDELKEGT